MCGHVFDHVGFLPETSVANVAGERLLPSVDLQVLLEVEPLGVDQEAANGAALVIRPMVVHVQVEVVEVAQKAVALDAVQRPKVVFDLAFIIGHGRVVHGRPADELLLLVHRGRLAFGLTGLFRAFWRVVVVAVNDRRARRAGRAVINDAAVILLHLLDFLHQRQMLDGVEVAQFFGLLLPDVGHAEGEAVVGHGGVEPGAFVVAVDVLCVVLGEFLLSPTMAKYRVNF